MKTFVGIDNSSLTHSVCIIDEEEKKIKEFFVNNNLDGFKKLHDILKCYENYSIGFELPHGPLIDYFRLNNIKNIYSFNPLKIKHFKDLQKVSGNKSDKIDAYAIALYLKKYIDRLTPMLFDSKEVEELNIYRISHDRLTKEHSRHLNKLRFITNQYFPLFNGLFAAFGCKVMLNMLLKYGTWNNLKDISSDEIRHFLIENRYRVNKNIDLVIKKIREYDQLISPELEVALSLEAQAGARILLTIKESIENVEGKMSKIKENHRLGKIFESIPGAGEVLSGKLLAIFGDNKNRFGKAQDIQCLFGTAPMNYQSGNYHKVVMRRACNKKSRATLYIFAFSSLRFCSWAREYYNMQRKKGKTNSVAIRALSNKWVKVIFSMWKKETEYNENMHQQKKYLSVA